MLYKIPLLQYWLRRLISASLLLFTFTTSAYADKFYTSNWDWQSASSVRISPTNGSPSIIFLPWLFGTNSLIPYDVAADHRKEDGWILLWSTFDGHILDANGNVFNSTSNYPFFALYNKFRGTARFYYLHTVVENDGNDLLWGITFDNTSGAKTSLLNYGFEFPLPETSRFTTPLITKPNLAVAGDSGPVAYHWHYFEFEPAYDPNTALTNDTSLPMRWLARGMNTSELHVTGTEVGNIKGSINIAGQNNTLLNLNLPFNISGSSVNNSINITGNSAASDTINRSADKHAPGLLQTQLKNLANSVLSSAGGAVGKLASNLFNSFVGGGNRTGNPQPNVNLRLETDITLNGTITTKKVIFHTLLKTPGTLNTSNGQGLYPLYDQPLGLLSVTEQPNVVWSEWFEKESTGTNYKYLQRYKIWQNGGFDVRLNPAVANELRIKSVEKKLIYYSNYAGPTTFTYVRGRYASALSGGDWVLYEAGIKGNRFYKSTYAALLNEYSADKSGNPVGGWGESWNAYWLQGKHPDDASGYRADSKVLVHVSVELERINTPPGVTYDTIIWSKVLQPKYLYNGCRNPVDKVGFTTSLPSNLEIQMCIYGPR